MTSAANRADPSRDEPTPPGVVVNDVHSRLNLTVVDRIITVRSTDDARAGILAAAAAGKPVCVSGGRHAMGGQQFAQGGVLLDTQPYNRVRHFDAERICRSSSIRRTAQAITIWSIRWPGPVSPAAQTG